MTFELCLKLLLFPASLLLPVLVGIATVRGWRPQEWRWLRLALLLTLASADWLAGCCVWAAMEWGPPAWRRGMAEAAIATGILAGLIALCLMVVPQWFVASGSPVGIAAFVLAVAVVEALFLRAELRRWFLGESPRSTSHLHRAIGLFALLAAALWFPWDTLCWIMPYALAYPGLGGYSVGYGGTTCIALPAGVVAGTGLYTVLMMLLILRLFHRGWDRVLRRENHPRH